MHGGIPDMHNRFAGLHNDLPELQKVFSGIRSAFKMKLFIGLLAIFDQL